jgi:hypothetical protein
VRLEITEVLGNLYLGFVEQLLEMANAERTIAKEVQDAQPRAVAETLINLHKVHGVFHAAK